LAASAREAVDVILEGKVKVEIRRVYPLAKAAQVHPDLEGRRTVGSIVMIP
jgi:NADPH2:quinone reductase